MPRAPAGYSAENPLVIGGRPFVGGEYIPNDLLGEADPQTRRKIDDAEAARQGQKRARHGRRAARPPADPDALRGRVEAHRDAELTDAARFNARRAYLALRDAHRGDMRQVLGRVEEILKDAERAHAQAGWRKDARLLARTKRRLATIGIFLDLAHADARRQGVKA